VIIGPLRFRRKRRSSPDVVITYVYGASGVRLRRRLRRTGAVCKRTARPALVSRVACDATSAQGVSRTFTHYWPWRTRQPPSSTVEWRPSVSGMKRKFPITTLAVPGRGISSRPARPREAAVGLVLRVPSWL